MSAHQAIAELRRLISLDGAFFPCLDDCGHRECELAERVLAIIEEVSA